MQALLHAAGETIAFVPVNAIQHRNAHSYLKDFGEELSVFFSVLFFLHYFSVSKIEFYWAH